MSVLDASIAVKWFVHEPGSEEAAQLLTRPEELFAPDLIRLEVAAALTRKVRLGHLTAEEARLRCDRWFQRLRQRALHLIPEDQILPDAIDLALLLAHPLQDCLYLAAARLVHAPLITADSTLQQRVAKAGLPLEVRDLLARH